MSFDLHQLERVVADHGPVCRVVVVSAKGSTPRGAGTAMLVWHDGQEGTIGGGRLELDATEMARKSLARGITHSAKAFALGPALGQCCGGAVTLSFELFTAETLPTVFPHAHPVMAPVSRPAAVDRAIARGVTTPQLVADWFIEPLARGGHPLWIWGAGHVGRALVATLAPLPDFAITWVDTAAARFPASVPDGVDRLVAGDPARAMGHAPQDADHLILTYSHEIDLALCHAALGRGFGFCGLIGSDTKWARFRSRLEALGHGSAQISRITCPIGDPGLGKHPQAIAVGVAAGLLNAHRHASRVTAPRQEGRG